MNFTIGMLVYIASTQITPTGLAVLMSPKPAFHDHNVSKAASGKIEADFYVTYTSHTIQNTTSSATRKTHSAFCSLQKTNCKNN